MHKYFLQLVGFARVVMMAWMVGIANSIKQENRFMDDTYYQIEVKDEQSDDEPFDLPY